MRIINEASIVGVVPGGGSRTELELLRDAVKGLIGTHEIVKRQVFDGKTRSALEITFKTYDFSEEFNIRLDSQLVRAIAIYTDSVIRHVSCARVYYRNPADYSTYQDETGQPESKPFVLARVCFYFSDDSRFYLVDPYLIHPDHTEGMINRWFNMEFIDDQCNSLLSSEYSWSLRLHPFPISS